MLQVGQILKRKLQKNQTKEEEKNMKTLVMVIKTIKMMAWQTVMGSGMAWQWKLQKKQKKEDEKKKPMVMVIKTRKMMAWQEQHQSGEQLLALSCRDPKHSQA